MSGFTISLVSPTLARSLDDDSLEGYGALALLAERIRQVHAGTPLDHAEYSDLVRICQLVEGMPLALEMAASWATTLTPAQIADGIRDSLDFLATSSDRPVADRHQSMRAVFHSSWDRLTPDGQAVFRRLSVFEDGFSLEAANEVAGADTISLATLINASLLGRGDSGRYHMHGLLSHFASEKLQEHPEEHRDLHERHTNYYLSLIANQAQALNGLDQPTALRTIGDDLANILAAWGWAIDHGDVANLLEAAPILWLYYVLGGRMHAGAETFDRLLEAFRTRSIPNVAGHDLLAAMTKCHAGGFISGLGRYEEAISLLTTGLEGFRTLISGRCIGVALNMLAAAELLKGDPMAARGHLEESLREAEQVQDRWSIAFAVNDLGMLLHLHFGETDAASYCERGRQLFRRVGDVRGEALAAHNLGVMATHAGDARRAFSLHREALAMREALGDLWGVATSLVQLGMVSGLAGDRSTAEQYLRRALRLAWESLILPVVLETLVELAAIDQDHRSARTTLLAVSRHPSVQEPVRARCESLLTSLGDSSGPVPGTHGDDVWAIHTVARLARSAATAGARRGVTA